MRGKIHHSVGFFDFLRLTRYMVESHISQIWRLEKIRYRLLGEICPHCKTKFFPPRDVCPSCDRYIQPLSSALKQKPIVVRSTK